MSQVLQLVSHEASIGTKIEFQNLDTTLCCESALLDLGKVLTDVWEQMNVSLNACLNLCIPCVFCLCTSLP